LGACEHRDVDPRPAECLGVGGSSQFQSLAFALRGVQILPYAVQLRLRLRQRGLRLFLRQRGLFQRLPPGRGPGQRRFQLRLRLRQRGVRGARLVLSQRQRGLCPLCLFLRPFQGRGAHRNLLVCQWHGM